MTQRQDLAQNPSPPSPPSSPSPPPPTLSFEERVVLARKHFERKGYRVHSGLQFGCELVLYADDPDHVHSDFCVHVVPVLPIVRNGQTQSQSQSCLNWMTIQTLARSMSTLHKQLIVVDVVPSFEGEDGALGALCKDDDDDDDNNNNDDGGGKDDPHDASTPHNQLQKKMYYYKVDEMAVASGHAPFRHKKDTAGVGGQVKKKSRIV
jgi:hypothetical protein